MSGACAYEDVLREVGFGPVAGADEAGRGACAGPLVAAAVILDPARPVEGLDNSKVLGPKRRAGLCERIMERAVAVAWTRVGPADYDALGMYEADLQGLRRVVTRLQVRLGFVLTDGLPVNGLGTPGLGIWKGDKVAACTSVTSIVAEVQRDAIMVTYEQEYPGYGLVVHKGYCTVAHKKALERFGPSPIHRLSHACVPDAARVWGTVSTEDLEQYESKLEPDPYREHKDVVSIFTYAVETERRFYLCNAADLKVRIEGSDVYYKVPMGDTWVWDTYCPARFVKSTKVLTFRDVSIEETTHSDLPVPNQTQTLFRESCPAVVYWVKRSDAPPS